MPRHSKCFYRHYGILHLWGKFSHAWSVGPGPWRQVGCHFRSRNVFLWVGAFLSLMWSNLSLRFVMLPENAFDVHWNNKSLLFVPSAWLLTGWPVISFRSIRLDYVQASCSFKSLTDFHGSVIYPGGGRQDGRIGSITSFFLHRDTDSTTIHGPISFMRNQ